MVQEEEREEAATNKKSADEAEQAALEAAKNSPMARMMSAADGAANGINMADIEANI
jgi:hypothetical protein